MIDYIASQYPVIPDAVSAASSYSSIAKHKLIATVQNTKELMNSMKSDAEHLSLGGKLALGAAAVGLAFEWSPANEWMLGYVSATVYEQTASSVLTGVAGGVTAGTEQFLIASGVSRVLDEADASINYLSERLPNIKKSNSKLKEFAISMSLGASALVINESIKNPHDKEKRKLATKRGASYVALGGTAIVGLIASSVKAVDGLIPNFSNDAVAVAKNPLTYLSIFGAAYLLDKRKNK